jgi:hypothetical protein
MAVGLLEYESSSTRTVGGFGSRDSGPWQIRETGDFRHNVITILLSTILQLRIYSRERVDSQRNRLRRRERAYFVDTLSATEGSPTSVSYTQVLYSILRAKS